MYDSVVDGVDGDQAERAAHGQFPWEDVVEDVVREEETLRREGEDEDWCGSRREGTNLG